MNIDKNKNEPLTIAIDALEKIKESLSIESDNKHMTCEEMAYDALNHIYSSIERNYNLLASVDNQNETLLKTEGHWGLIKDPKYKRFIIHYKNGEFFHTKALGYRFAIIQGMCHILLQSRIVEIEKIENEDTGEYITDISLSVSYSQK